MPSACVHPVELGRLAVGEKGGGLAGKLREFFQ